MKMKRNTALGILLLAGALFTAPRVKADGIFTATLLGSNEVPSNASPATGAITVSLVGDLLSVSESFSGLTGGSASAAHIHCCAVPGVNAIVAVPFPGFPAATSGTYSNTFDLTLDATYNAAFETANGGTAAGAESALKAALFSGQTYANIHDATFPGGEIRGQLVQTPEPATGGLLLVGFGMMMRKRYTQWRRRANQTN
jgi:hypothetical protein